MTNRPVNHDKQTGKFEKPEAREKNSLFFLSTKFKNNNNSNETVGQSL